MRVSAGIAFVVALMVSGLTQAANVWSGCQTVTGVTNQPVGNTNVLLALSPGIPGCSSQGVPGAVTFQVGQAGVVADNLSSFLASGLAALGVGRQVQITYDDSSLPNCWATAGTNGQCP